MNYTDNFGECADDSSAFNFFNNLEVRKKLNIF